MEGLNNWHGVMATLDEPFDRATIRRAAENVDTRAWPSLTQTLYLMRVFGLVESVGCGKFKRTLHFQNDSVPNVFKHLKTWGLSGR